MAEVLPVSSIPGPVNGLLDFLQSVNASNEERDQVMRELARASTSFKAELATIKTDTNDMRNEQRRLREEMREVRDLLKSVGLTTGQKRAVQSHASKAAYASSEEDGHSVRKHYANIYGGLKDKFSVGSYWEIPRENYQETIRLIDKYDGSSKNWWRE